MKRTLSQKIYSLYYRWRLFDDSILRHFYKLPHIITVEETLCTIIKRKCSLSRFGDGEISIIYGNSLNFQPYNKQLSLKLKKTLLSQQQNLLIALPRIFNDKWLVDFSSNDTSFWKNHLLFWRKKWLKHINSNIIYGDSLCTRFYSYSFNYANASRIYSLWSLIWANRDIIIIEGQDSKLGVGNDCFSQANSIKRIIAPSKNAFSYYERILAECYNHNKDALYLIALGPTATVLAHDLSISGRQALDIGHIDLEYEWWQHKTNKKTTIPGKFCNETFLTKEQASEVVGTIDSSALDIYKSQIVSIIQ